MEMTDAPTRALLTRHELADLLRVSVSTVDRLRVRGVIRPVQLVPNGRVGFRVEDVEALLDAPPEPHPARLRTGLALMAGRPQRRARLAAGLPAPQGNGTRPPFPKGNQVARKHGGYALLGLGDRASEIADEIRPTLAAYAPADEPTLLLLATTLARIERANAAIEIVDSNSTSPLSEYLAGDEPTLAPNLSALRNDLRAWINTARRLANDLGLTPTSRAKLGLDIVAAQRIGSGLVERYGGRVT